MRANFGFAILSDIEVFFLIQAAKGDVRYQHYAGSHRYDVQRAKRKCHRWRSAAVRYLSRARCRRLLRSQQSTDYHDLARWHEPERDRRGDR